MDLKDLEKIGLTEGERKVYQALISLGECTKTALVRESKIPPSNLYDITNRLIQKGLISKVDKNGVAHFSPASPNRILDFLKNKKEEINKEESLVKALLPTLLAQFKDQKKGVGVEVFVGWQGFKTVFEDLLEECGKDDQNYIFGASVGADESKSDQFFLKYSKMREKKDIKTNIIFNRMSKERPHRFLPQQPKLYIDSLTNQHLQDSPL